MTPQEQMVVDLASFAYDPLGFVHWAFPWGHGPLENHKGPDRWQTYELQQLGEELHEPRGAHRFATASGHGVGKSAKVAWTNLWAFSTFPGTRGIITANTEVQLKTRTWVEMAKWFDMFVAKELFTLTATGLFARTGKSIDKQWRLDFTPWNEKNPSAFQGLHNEGKRLAITFDEASEVPPVIWEAIEGAMTDDTCEIYFWVYGNPTKADGRFRECFHGGRFASRWKHYHVDGRDSKITNKKQLDEWIEDWGLESDFVRVRVLGQFPRALGDTFISYESALEATERKIETPPDYEPLILGIDSARFGDDFSTIYPRKGRDARSRPPRIFQGLDSYDFAREVAIAFKEYQADVCMVDASGVGGPLCDNLRKLYRIPIVEVDFGSGPDGVDSHDPSTKYANKRTEIYGVLRHWLQSGAIVHTIPGYDRDLPREMSNVRYGFRESDQALQLVPKKLTKKEFGSPDVTDALACTFAMPWMKDHAVQIQTATVAKDYDPFSEDMIYADV